MSPEDQANYRFLVSIAGDVVRNIAIGAIETVALTDPDPAYPTLHRVVIKTKAQVETVFFFRDGERARVEVSNILEAREKIQQYVITLYPDINQHLIRPA